MMENNRIRIHYMIYGRVQGVGFRYRAMHAAQSLGITGFVRNRADGSVEMEAEGTEEQLHRLIPAIERGTWIRVDQVDSRRIPLQESRDFVCLDDEWL